MSSAERRLHLLAFEPFDSGSHRAVRKAITRHSRHHWRWFTRPGRFWKWRMRLAAIELLEEAASSGAGEGAFDARVDAIFLTSLMSAADLRALLPAQLRSVPIVLYMHENQAEYPEGHFSPLSAERDLQYPLTNLTSVLTADCVIWNSAWNRDSFLAGIEQVIRVSPDHAMPSDLRERIEKKSEVIWPPVEPPPVGVTDDGVAVPEILHNAGRSDFSDVAGGRQGGGEQVINDRHTHRSDAEHDLSSPPSPSALSEVKTVRDDLKQPVRIVWPHRWEHDKGPDELLRFARLCTEPLNLRWTILGEQYRTIPEALRTFQSEFASVIDHIGYEPDRERYWQHLARCDWVLSTARHEFFGIAVVEALFAGCLPWLPNRLSYPELLPANARDLSPIHPPRDAEQVRCAIRDHLRPAIASNSVAMLDSILDEVSA